MMLKKASAFCNYFSSVFTLENSNITIIKESDYNLHLHDVTIERTLNEIEFTETGIFKALGSAKCI